MIFLMMFLICVFLALAVAGLAGFSDVRTMTIPNSYSLYIIVSFLLCFCVFYIGGVKGVFGSPLSHLLSVLLTFGVTFVLYGLKMLGAGDSKFAAACAFWISVKYLPIFLFFMTLAGAGLGLVALYVKKKKPFKSPAAGSWFAQVQGGADKVPYGVAITFGLVMAFLYSGYFSPNTLASFLS